MSSGGDEVESLDRENQEDKEFDNKERRNKVKKKDIMGHISVTVNEG